MSIFKDPVLQLSEYNEIYSIEPLRYGEHKRYSTQKKKKKELQLMYKRNLQFEDMQHNSNPL